MKNLSLLTTLFVVLSLVSCQINKGTPYRPASPVLSKPYKPASPIVSTQTKEVFVAPTPVRPSPTMVPTPTPVSTPIIVVKTTDNNSMVGNIVKSIVQSYLNAPRKQPALTPVPVDVPTSVSSVVTTTSDTLTSGTQTAQPVKSGKPPVAFLIAFAVIMLFQWAVGKWTEKRKNGQS